MARCTSSTRKATKLPQGEIGTVYFEGGGTFRYYKDEEKTARAFNAKGWSTLGDLGYVDEEGYLYLADRRTDLILTGGVNVYPREVEDALVMHPAVADVAVIGVPDEDLGERVEGRRTARRRCAGHAGAPRRAGGAHPRANRRVQVPARVGVRRPAPPHRGRQDARRSLRQPEPPQRSSSRRSWL